MKLFELRSRGIVSALVLVGAFGFASADITDFNLGSGVSVGGYTYNADVDFLSVSGGVLTIKFSNLSTQIESTSAQSLTGFAFDFDNSAGFTMAALAANHVNLTAGSVYWDTTSHNTTSPTQAQMDTGYQWKGGITAFGVTNGYGFSSVGIGSFDTNGTGSDGFGADAGHWSLGSHQELAIGQTTFPDGMPGKLPSIGNSITFTITVTGADDATIAAELTNHINDFSFMFGTLPEFTQSNGGGGHRFLTPEPITSSLMGASALLFLRRRARNRKA